jgi:purine-binding chemotaxis protein CheW
VTQGVSMADKEINKKLNILHFKLQDIQFCVDLNVVDKVLLLAFIEKIPNSPNYLVGLMNFSGNSVPVIDLSLRLGLNRDTIYTLDTPIILCTKGSHRVGIVVDEILGIQQIEKDLVQMNEDFRDENTHILGVVKRNDDLILILNSETILDIHLTMKKNIKTKLTQMADN